MPRRAFIIGGTGPIGRAVAADLAAHGWRVTASSRGLREGFVGPAADAVEAVRLDREEKGALSKALAGGADAVVDTIAYTSDHADQLLEIEGAVGAFVVISSASVYRDTDGRTLDEAARHGFPVFPGPIAETEPTVAPGPETYSTRKVAMERRLNERAKRPVAILRPCAVHGPYSLHPREWRFVKRMLDQRPIIPLAYLGKSLFHTSATLNIAALTRAALDNPGTRILNAADPHAPTVAEIGAAIGGHVGYSGKFCPIGGVADDLPPRVGFTPWSTPLPFTLDLRAAAAFGYQAVASYAEAVGETCRWLVKQNPADWRERFPVLASYVHDQFDYAAEDEFLSRCGQLAPRPS